MKCLPTICLLFLMSYGFGQNTITDPATLSRKLTENLRTEKEKVTAIFHWITHNISYYRPDPVRNKKKRVQEEWKENNIEETGELPSLDERVATTVLQNGRAVCEGYARLFKSLCDHAGIQSQLLTGYARTRMGDKDSRFRSNHTWNAVCVDSNWYLLDATWASGYIAWPSGEFVQHYDDTYFLTAPEKFIQHHYPDDPHWTLISESPSIPEFRNTPFRQKSFNKYGITEFYPDKGIIETEIGDTIRLEIKTYNPLHNMSIAPDSLWDPATLPQTSLYAYVQPESTTSGSKVIYNFLVQSENTQWLYLMFNNDAVLRYRLQIKKPGENKPGD